ncbi:MAG: hypothetical protein AB1606_06330 [Nitrospirota bacterium]
MILKTKNKGFTPLENASHFRVTHIRKNISNGVRIGSLTGFTLIELAIILVIIGILVSLGAALIGPLTKRAKYTETKEIVDAAVESVTSYAAANNRIPAITEFPTVVRNPRDAWTKDLYYVPDANLDDLLAGGVCGRKTTGITVRDCTNSDCSTYNDIPNVAFVVISGAENYNIQTGNVGGRVTVYEVGTPNIDDHPADMNRPEPYDDIVKWVTLDELRIKAGCVGAQLKILNNELPYGFQENPYSAIVYADGGVPFSSGGYYKWCLKGSLPTGISNPTPGCPLTSSCSALANDEDTGWTQGDSLTISGTPTESGSFNITVLARDNNDNNTADNKDNCAERSFAMTINPSVVVPCSEYRVWNDTGATYDFIVDGWCSNNVLNGAEITTPTRRLGPGETIDRYSRLGICSGAILAQLTYSQAVSADTNKDCCVNFTGTDRTCP